MTRSARVDLAQTARRVAVAAALTLWVGLDVVLDVI